MRLDIFLKIVYAKIMLILVPIYKRQKYVDLLKDYAIGYVIDLKEDIVDELLDQIDLLSDEDRDKLFKNSFVIYRFFRFRKTRIEIDNNEEEEYRTFEQFNKILAMNLLIFDCEKSTLKNN